MGVSITLLCICTSALALRPPSTLIKSRSVRRAAPDDDEDARLGRQRFADALDDGALAEGYEQRFPLPLVTAALLAPTVLAAAAPVLGLLPAGGAPDDAPRFLLATAGAAAVMRGADASLLRAAVALPLCPLRLTGDDDALPARVAARYGAEDLAAAALAAAYATTSSVFAHGVLQGYLTDSAIRIASIGAMWAMPADYDPVTTWWWPLVASWTALAPAVAAAGAGAAGYACERALLDPWRSSPAAADPRVARVFALDAPPERAARRTAAYEAAADAWRADRRDEANAAVVCAVATSAAACVTHSWVAPCVARVIATRLQVRRQP